MKIHEVSIKWFFELDIEEASRFEFVKKEPLAFFIELVENFNGFLSGI